MHSVSPSETTHAPSAQERIASENVESAAVFITFASI